VRFLTDSVLGGGGIRSSECYHQDYGSFLPLRVGVAKALNISTTGAQSRSPTLAKRRTTLSGQSQTFPRQSSSRSVKAGIRRMSNSVHGAAGTQRGIPTACRNIKSDDCCQVRTCPRLLPRNRRPLPHPRFAAPLFSITRKR